MNAKCQANGRHTGGAKIVRGLARLRAFGGQKGLGNKQVYNTTYSPSAKTGEAEINRLRAAMPE